MVRYIVAAVQLDSQEDKKENLRAVAMFIDEAASKKARVIGLPEMMNYFGSEEGEMENAEEIGGETTRLLCDKAKQHGVWIHGGSICERVKGRDRIFNTTMLIDPKGEIKGIYRKTHLFDVEISSGPSYMESNVIAPGDEVVVVDTELGRVGLSICYDIRFPELYRIMALGGSQLIFTPAGFTLFTGRDHWMPLLRARAIENSNYVIAPAQIGQKSTFQTHGKSMIIDPWGNIIAAASDYPGVITAEIDLDYIERVRSQIPSIKNRRPDLYSKYEGK